MLNVAPTLSYLLKFTFQSPITLNKGQILCLCLKNRYIENVSSIKQYVYSQLAF